MTASSLSHSLLKEILSYDEETGVFAWAKSRGNQYTRKGMIAGSIDSSGHRQIEINGKAYAAHRLAWFYVNGNWPEKQIDHINRVRDDNRILNLRDVDSSANMQNSISTKNGRLRGATFRKQMNKWVAQKNTTASKDI